MTVSEQINRLSLVKSRIRNSIIAKGVAVPTDSTFFSYADFIRAIQGGSGGSEIHVEQNVVIAYWTDWEVHGFDEIEQPDRVYKDIIETPSVRYS